jgi:hypothetical protein
VLRQTRERGIPFAIGGGLAVALYVPQRQSTKDIDIYVKPSDREEMIEIVTGCGLKDYYEKLPYDRHWIYRSYKGESIVDVMWGMPNRRAVVDDEWLARGPEIEVHGERVRALPPEELIWAKLYVLQRDRSDWPDILNIVYATGPSLDWDHLIRRVGADAPLLEAILTIFAWLCPDRAARIPAAVRRKLKEAARGPGVGIPRDSLLDTRPWFLPRLEEERKAC